MNAFFVSLGKLCNQVANQSLFIRAFKCFVKRARCSQCTYEEFSNSSRNARKAFPYCIESCNNGKANTKKLSSVLQQYVRVAYFSGVYLLQLYWIV